MGENANENPQKYHWKVMTDIEAIQAQIILRADFRRARPEYRNPSPGTITITMAEAARIYAWSPDWNHLLRFSVPASVSCLL